MQGLRYSTVVTNDMAQAIRSFGEALAAESLPIGGPCPEFRVHVEGNSRDLVPLVRDEVYRIACEAVRNAFRHAQAGRIEVEIQYDQRQLRLRVRDNGKGIDPSVWTKAAAPDTTACRACRNAPSWRGASWLVWSERDSGTEIELTIPAALAYAESPVATRPRSPGKGTSGDNTTKELLSSPPFWWMHLRRSGDSLGRRCSGRQMMEQDRIRVLSVDDHALLREGIAMIINCQPDMVIVSQASGGKEAIEQYREHRPDVTLMDLRMPDLSSIDALAAIRAEFPEARIIMLTTFESDEEVQRALKAGACGFLLKSIPPRDLLQTIRQVHAGQ